MARAAAPAGPVGGLRPVPPGPAHWPCPACKSGVWGTAWTHLRSPGPPSSHCAPRSTLTSGNPALARGKLEAPHSCATLARLASTLALGAPGVPPPSPPRPHPRPAPASHLAPDKGFRRPHHQRSQVNKACCSLFSPPPAVGG